MLLTNEMITRIADLIIPAGPKGEPSASQSRAVAFIIDYLENGRTFTEEICNLLNEMPDIALIDEPMLIQLELNNPESFRRLVELVYTAYYGDPELVEKLGLPGPPQPKGYRMDPFDENLLKEVKSNYESSSM